MAAAAFSVSAETSEERPAAVAVEVSEVGTLRGVEGSQFSAHERDKWKASAREDRGDDVNHAAHAEVGQQGLLQRERGSSSTYRFWKRAGATEVTLASASTTVTRAVVFGARTATWPCPPAFGKSGCG